MSDGQVSYGQSLAGRLFKLVFGGYLILAVLVTGVQLVLEYSSVQRLIKDDLISLGQSFNGGVAGAMWELDRPLMRTMAQGIAQSSIVTGVSISAADGHLIASVGTIPDAVQEDLSGLLAPYQLNSTRLEKKTPNGVRDLGSLTIYADRSVALERVKYSFFVILINSLIKTAGLWLIFYLVITKGLSRPLAKLTDVVSQLEFAAESKEAISLNYPHEDELGRLVGAMQKMQKRLFAAHHELEQVNADLEKTVAERTQHLLQANDFNETVLLCSPLPMGVYAADGQCVLANEVYAQLVGATRDALLKQNFRNIEAWRISGLLDDCLSALQNHWPRQREIEVRSSFGKELCLECRVLPTQLNGKEHLLIQFVDLTERKRQEMELRHLATHDPLTQLPNRRLLVDRLQKALLTSKRDRNHLAVLFLDLDQFKALNDAYGHDVGDLLLVEVARRLRETVRDSDTVARLGGDEFVVVLEGLGQSIEQAQTYLASIVDKLHLALDADYVLGGVRYKGSASIGAKLFLGCEAGPNEVLKEVDAAMYQEKRGERAAE